MRTIVAILAVALLSGCASDVPVPNQPEVPEDDWGWYDIDPFLDFPFNTTHPTMAAWEYRESGDVWEYVTIETEWETGGAYRVMLYNLHTRPHDVAGSQQWSEHETMREAQSEALLFMYEHPGGAFFV